MMLYPIVVLVNDDVIAEIKKVTESFPGEFPVEELAAKGWTPEMFMGGIVMIGWLNDRRATSELAGPTA